MPSASFADVVGMLQDHPDDNKTGETDRTRYLVGKQNHNENFCCWSKQHHQYRQPSDPPNRVNSNSTTQQQQSNDTHHQTSFASVDHKSDLPVSEVATSDLLALDRDRLISLGDKHDQFSSSEATGLSHQRYQPQTISKMSSSTSSSAFSSFPSSTGAPPGSGPSRRGFIEIDEKTLSPLARQGHGPPIDPSFLDKASATAVPPGKYPIATQPYPPPIPLSRNSIFDTPQIILKPALKMTTEELEVLKSGGNVGMDGVVLSPSTTTPANSSIQSQPPSSIQSNPPPYTSSPTHSPQGSPQPIRKDTNNAISPLRLSAANSNPLPGPRNDDRRRGFVDLDEIEPQSPQRYGYNASAKTPYPPPRNAMSDLPPPIRVKDGDPPPPLRQQSSSSAMASSTNTLPRVSKRRSTPLPKVGGRDERNPLGLMVVTNPASAFDNINLSFLPIKKNFLGEGRYAQVFLGQYTVANPASEVGVGGNSGGVISGGVLSGSSDTPVGGQQASGNSLLTANDQERRISLTPGASESPQSDTTGSTVAHSQINSTATTTTTTTEFRTCAVKRLHQTPECQTIGLTELYILRRIGNHPNIVKLIGAKDEMDVEAKAAKAKAVASGSAAPSVNVQEFLDPTPRLLILLDFEEGGTMWDFIEDVRESGGIGQELWLKWSRQLASAVDYIHSLGIVHHDIKPHNCLLSANNDVKLADFGSACFVPGYGPPLDPTQPDSPLVLDFKDQISTYNPPPIDRRMSSSPVMDTTNMTAATATTSSITPALSTASSSSDATSISTSNQHQHQHPFQVPTIELAAASNTPFSSTPFSTDIPESPNTASPLLQPQYTSHPLGPSSKPNNQYSYSSISSSSTTGSLRDGLGRGTQAYSAPELFNTPNDGSSGGGMYSFPIDVYSVGVTMHVAVTGMDPFALAKSSLHLMMAVKKGYWDYGLQPGVGTDGPAVSLDINGDDGGSTADDGASGVSTRRRQGQRQRRVLLGGIQKGSGIEMNRWLRGDSDEGIRHGSGRVKFPNGDLLDDEFVRIMCACLEKDPN
ncbi:hypothetical protein HDU76_013612, partial [Blyttiomyces sp. JEL0837]